MRSLSTSIRQLSAALRMLLIFTVICGIAYPLAITLIAQLPGLKHRADGSQLNLSGRVVGSSLLGQSFTDPHGRPLLQYFQSRPSAAGDGYDPTATGASNLGPESIVDTLPNPADKTDTGSRACSPRSAPAAWPSASSTAWTDPGRSARLTVPAPSSRSSGPAPVTTATSRGR
jgi:potassium-transporting ATPase KdpC subunit